MRAPQHHQIPIGFQLTKGKIFCEHVAQSSKYLCQRRSEQPVTHNMALKSVKANVPLFPLAQDSLGDPVVFAVIWYHGQQDCSAVPVPPVSQRTLSKGQ